MQHQALDSVSRYRKQCRLSLYRWRFSLRHLILAVAVAQIPLVFFVWIRDRVRREAAAVESLIAAGPAKVSRAATISIDSDNNRWRGVNSSAQDYLASSTLEPWFFGVSGLEADDRKLDSDALAALSELRSLQFLRIRRSQVDSEVKMPTNGYDHLVFLDLKYSALSDEFMRVVGTSSALEELRLEYCTCPPRSLRRLSGLENLKQLRIYRAKLADEDFDFLRHLTSLRYLNASHLPDAVIPLDKVPRSLKVIDVSGTRCNVSPDCAELPNLASLGIARCHVSLTEMMWVLRHCPSRLQVYIAADDFTADETAQLLAAFPAMAFQFEPDSSVQHNEVD